MIVLTDAQVRRYVKPAAVLKAMRGAFVALEEGRSSIFPVVHGTGSDPEHSIAIKAGRDWHTRLNGIKTASYNPSNRHRGLSPHTSTTLLVDDLTATALAVVEAGYLNGMRTAAADALATSRLARHDASTLVVIGLGDQAIFEVEAVAAVRPIARVIGASRNATADARFLDRVRRIGGFETLILPAAEAVAQADIVVTATPSCTPVLERAWVRPGTHISAMGADDVGKQELPTDLVASGQLYVDHPEQAAVIGEAQHVVAAGAMTLEQLRHRSLGALLTGAAPGRADDDAITIFDSSGVAVQDIAAAACAMQIVAAAEGWSHMLPQELAAWV